MTAVLLRLRTEARARWRAWMGVAILAGLVGGAAIAALAGARRTETAYPRFLHGTRAFDVLVTNGGTTPDNVNRQFDFAEVARLAPVAEAVKLSYYFPEGTTSSGRPVGPSELTPLGSPDGRFGTDVNGARVIEGRLPVALDDVAVTVGAADRLGIDLGETIILRLPGPEAMAQAFSEGGGGMAGRPAGGSSGDSFHVVGIIAMQGGFPPLTGGLPPPVLLSPVYAKEHPDAAEVFAVRLRRGTADIAAFERDLDRLAGGEQVVATNRLEQTSVVQRSLGVQAAALRLLAAVACAVALLLLGQALSRQALVDSRDDGVLRALGVSPSQLRVLGTVRAVLIAAVAALVAVATAVALSALTPVGAARHAELNPGVDLNVAYLASGAAAVLVVVVLLGALRSWWPPRPALGAGAPTGGPNSPGRLVSRLATAGFSAPAVSGVRMALEPGQGRSAVPVRSSIASAAFGVATIAAVFTFSSSLGNLFDEPRLYGWTWDVQFGDAFSPALDEQAEHLGREPAVAAEAVGTISRLQIGQLRVDTLAIQAVKGVLDPTVVEGGAPRGPTDIMLGTRTLHDLGLRIGDSVTIGSGDRTASMRIVGRGVLTEFAGAARLGEGAAVTLEGMRRLVPDAEADVVLLRLRPGAEGAALLARLVAEPPGNVYLPEQPSDLADLERVGGLPSVVAGLLSVMAMATLAHTLVMSVRRRRRDLAVLKVLGFVRRQVSATLAWQATVVAVLAIVAGVPLGVVSGRWAWQAFADRLGVPPQPTTPVVALAVLVAATVVLANVVAALPARLAASTPATATLRTE